MGPRVWYLNLAADDELASPAGATPSLATRARVAALASRLAGLVPPGDVAVREGEVVGAQTFSGYAGVAWCPTPGALRALAGLGARAPDAPPVAVLRAVNHRRFSAALGPTLPGARYVATRAALDEALAAAAPVTGWWLLKRPFGFAGRGRRRVRAGALDAADVAWIAASLRAGEGLAVEPWVERRGDYARHGYVTRDGAVLLGEATVQRCDDAGAWLETRRARAGELAADEALALERAAREAGAALRAAGYRGPFGVDAFRWWDGVGLRFNPRCEVNARYSMGWAIGLGALRPDLDEA